MSSTMTGVGEAGAGVDDDDEDSGEAIPPERAQGGREEGEHTSPGSDEWRNVMYRVWTTKTKSHPEILRLLTKRADFAKKYFCFVFWLETQGKVSQEDTLVMRDARLLCCRCWKRKLNQEGKRGFHKKCDLNFPLGAFFSSLGKKWRVAASMAMRRMQARFFFHDCDINSRPEFFRTANPLLCRIKGERETCSKQKQVLLLLLLSQGGGKSKRKEEKRDGD